MATATWIIGLTLMTCGGLFWIFCHAGTSPNRTEIEKMKSGEKSEIFPNITEAEEHDVITLRYTRIAQVIFFVGAAILLCYFIWKTFL